MVLEKVPQPASGGGLTFPIDGTYWRRLVSMAGVLTCSAVAGQRSLSLAYADGDANVWNLLPLAAQIFPGQVLPFFGDQATVSPVAGNGLTPAAVAVANTFAATGSATVTLPNGAAITGFDVTQSSVAANATGVVTVTGAQGGTLTYDAVATTTATDNLSIRFPSPLQPAAGAAGIAVTYTGGASTPAGTVTAYGQAAAVSAQAQLPDFILKSGWQLLLQLGGAQVGDQISGVQFLMERYPSSDIELHGGGGWQLLDALAAAIAGA
jgi:hypothetical protein